MSGVMPHFLLYDFMRWTGTIPVYRYFIHCTGREMNLRSGLSAMGKEKILTSSVVVMK